jgi:hypothetical protein
MTFRPDREPAGFLGRAALVAPEVVKYRADDSTVVQFEVDPAQGFRPAGTGDIAGRVRDAVGPAVEAARVVLEKAKEARPDEVELKFGVKVTGGATWMVARAAAEASFEITLTWRQHPDGSTGREAGPGGSPGTEPGQGGGGSARDGTAGREVPIGEDDGPGQA